MDEGGQSDNPPVDGRLLAVLESAAQLQRVVPDAVLVGGSAAAFSRTPTAWAGHRLSSDHDHLVVDLGERFDAVLEAIEATDGWVTNRVTPYKIILGRLGDIEAGVRQLRRTRPLETVEILLPSGRPLRVPAPDETLRVKAYLVTVRNQVRDYLDVAALSDRYGLDHAAAVLAGIDDYYEDQHTAHGEPGGVSSQLVRQLADPRPRDHTVIGELSAYKGLQPRWQDWSQVRGQCAALASAIVERSL